jgi:hypothetical protein
MKDLVTKSLKDINFIALIIVALFASAVLNIADPDFWSRLYCGAAYLDNGWVLYRDIFTFSPAKDIWVDHEWLSSIILFFIFKNYGFTGILIFKSTAAILVMWLIYLIARLRLDTNKNIFYLMLVLFALAPGLASNMRSHIFTYLFFLLWMLILEHSRLKETQKYLWILPVSMILWVNLHGGCIAGLALLGIYTISQLIERKEFKPYLIVLVISILLTIVNPYTYHYYLFIIDELTAKHYQISEWAKLDLKNIEDFKFFKLLLLVGIIAFIFSKKPKSDPAAIILLVSLAFFSFMAVRHTMIFSLVAGVFIYEHLSDIYQRLLKDLRTKKGDEYANIIDFFLNKGFAIIVIIVFTALLSTINFSDWKFKFLQEKYPLNAIRFIKENSLKGNILIPFHWGSYATWRLYPDNKVSIDGRYVTAFPEKVYNENLDFYFARKNWKNFLETFKPDILLVDQKFSPVYEKLLKEKYWRIIYEDSYAAIFIPYNNPEINNLKEIKKIHPSKIDHFDSYFLRE